MKHDYQYYQQIIQECFISQGKHFSKVPESQLKRNLCLIDEYLEVVLDTFLSHGLGENDEPNNYGFKLEDVKDYLLQLRYAIVD